MVYPISFNYICIIVNVCVFVLETVVTSCGGRGGS